MAIYTRFGDKGFTQSLLGIRLNKGDWLVNSLGNLDELNSYFGLVTSMMESIRAAYVMQNNGDQEVNDSVAAKIDVGLASLVGQFRDTQRELFEIGATLQKMMNENNSVAITSNKDDESNVKRSNMTRLAESFVNKDKKTAIGEEREAIEKKVRDSNVRYDVLRLERLIDEMDEDLPRLENFILPGGGVIGAQMMIARAVCRRFERELVRYFVNFEKRSRKNLQERSSQKSTEFEDYERMKNQILAYVNRLGDYIFVSSRWVNWLMEEEELLWKRD